MIRTNSLKKDNNYLIADYILSHLNEMENKSIKQLAQDCFVSTTAILAFCKLLGLHSYSEFKNKLLSTMKTRKLQLMEKNKDLRAKDLLQFISAFSLEAFDTLQFEREVQQVIEQIKKYKAIYLYGATFPLALATSFIEDMALLGIYVHTIQVNYDKPVVKEEPGVHIVITLSGRYLEANRNYYMQITALNYPSLLISRKVENKGEADYCIHLPSTISSQYDEMIILFIYDYILLNV